MTDAVNKVRLRAATAVVGAGTLLSRVAGLVREVVMAAWFGATGAADVFFVAYRIPNTLRRLLAEGGVTVAVQPVYAAILAREPGRRAGFEASVFGTGRLLLLAASVLVFLAAPLLVPLFAAGFTPGSERWADAVTLLRILSPFVYFVGLMGIGMGLLHSLGRFFVPAVGSAVLNLAMVAGIIAGSWWLRPDWPPTTGLALGAVAGMALWWWWTAAALRRAGGRTGGRPDFREPGVREAGMLLVPAVAGLAVYQLQVVVGTQFASFLPEGGVSALSYADRLVQFPLSLLGTAVGTVALPLFARARAREESLNGPLADAMGWMLFLVLPASVGLALVAEPMVTAIYQRGAFDAAASARSAAALVGYSAALLPAALSRLLMPAHYADRDMRTPVAGAFVALMVQTACSFAWFRYDVAGLAAATAAGSWAQVVFLGLRLRRRGVRPAGLGRGVWRSLIGSGLMAAVVWGLARFSSDLPALLDLGLRAGLGVLVYLGFCALAGHPEWQRLQTVWRQRRQS